MRILSGALLILAGLFLGLSGAHLARRKAWDRPRWALHPAFRSAWRPARWALLAAGLVVLGAESASALVVGVVLLLALWAQLVWVRSPRHALGRLRREVNALEARSQGTPRADLVVRVLCGWHPEWPREVVRQIVEENPALEDVARFVVRMERGWPF